jgi:hypothetical protein
VENDVKCKMSKSPLVASAIRLDDGTILTDKRHGGILLALGAKGNKEKITQAKQGFVDTNGVFLNREEAYWRAIECGQLKENPEGKTHKLLSEDIW